MADGDLSASGGRKLCVACVARDDQWQRGICVLVMGGIDLWPVPVACEARDDQWHRGGSAC